MRQMWGAATAAGDAFSDWADAVAAADGRLTRGHGPGLPLVLAAQAAFRSQARPCTAASCHTGRQLSG